jgi:hypothetical protein
VFYRLENEKLESTIRGAESSKMLALESMELNKPGIERKNRVMTNKEIVQDLLRRLPDYASLEDIARSLRFIAAVRQGITELDQGDSVPD